MTWSMERNIVGYADKPPAAQWPNGARIAINFVLNFEEGSEYSLQDQDGFTDSGLTEMAASPVPKGNRDLAAESMFEYGSRVGFWRILRIFQERDLPMTVFGCALALERQPKAAAAIREAGYDICCHGWRWIEHFRLTEEEERKHIKLAIESIRKTLGDRPYGWYCRYGPSTHTRNLVLEEGGFVYDSDAYNDDLPYFLETLQGNHHLVIPYTLTNNDTKFSHGNIGTGQEFFTYLKEAFDVLYDEGKTTPKMMNIGMHCRILGHASRASGLIKFLDYVKSKPDVWVTRRIDIAKHWIEKHSPPAAK